MTRTLRAVFGESTEAAEHVHRASMTGRPFRLAHVVSHPIQYFAPLYRELAARPEIDLTVFFCSDVSLATFHDPEFGREIAWDSDLVGGFEWRLVPSAYGRSLKTVRERIQTDLFRALVGGRFDGIWVHGYSYPNAWIAALAAALSRASFLIREEQTLLHGRGIAKRIVKRAALKILFARSVGLAIGRENRRYFEHYGVSRSNLFDAPYAVDNRLLQQRAIDLGPVRRDLREALGIRDESPVVLFVGKLIQKKEPLLLLDAFARAREHRPCWLVIVGDGPLAPEVDAAIAHNHIPNVIRAGFVNQGDLPSYYAAADVFVLPSSRHETWGLVVNEALNFSLPVVVTDKVGCAADLVPSGETGFVVPARDSTTLSERIALLVDDADLRRSLGVRGRNLVASYSVERAADGIVRACLSRRRAA